MSSCIFICADEDFLATRRAQEIFTEYSASGELDAEVLEADAQNLQELETFFASFHQATRTLPLFGARKLLWLKGVSFLGGGQLGRFEGTKRLVDAWLEAMDALFASDAGTLELLVSAAPVDRRARAYKWFERNAKLTDLTWKQGQGDVAFVQSQAKALGLVLEPAALQALLGKVGPNARLLSLELEKLRAYLGEQGDTVSESMVFALVADFASHEFFEAVEAFFALDLDWALRALKWQFYNDKHVARPLLSALMNRCRLMIQLRVLVDGGELQLGSNGFQKHAFERAAERYCKHFGAFDSKSSFNIFTQNLWYLNNKIAVRSQQLSLRRWVDFQIAFAEAFGKILESPEHAHGILQALFMECLRPPA